jgi:peptidyl-prolyl cis-trans isomerase B (cyclophilin B)
LAKTNKSTLDAAKKSLQGFEAKQNVIDHRVKVRARDNRLAVIITAAVVLFASASQYVYFNFGPGVPLTACINFTQTPIPSVSGEASPIQIPDAAISECRDWNGTMTINKASLGITLHGKLAPQAVANFVQLTNTDGFYTGISCHRLTTSGIFVLQCGDPTVSATGGPVFNGKPWPGIPDENLPVGQTIYPAGTIAMANSGKNKNGSQFFFVYEDSVLNPYYTVWGRITSGLETLRAIGAVGAVKQGQDGKYYYNGDGFPIQAVEIRRVVVR